MEYSEVNGVTVNSAEIPIAALLFQRDLLEAILWGAFWLHMMLLSVF